MTILDGARPTPIGGDTLGDPPAGRVDRLRRWTWRHGALLAVLAVGIGLRLALRLSYRPGLFYSDSLSYVRAIYPGIPLVDRPYGYTAFIQLFWHFNSIELIITLQHLMALALAVAGYALLVRRGVRHWLAALATVPVVLDARHLVLEHFVLAEVLFTFLLGIAVLLIARRKPPGVVAATLAGALVAGAGLTRSVGLPVAGLLLLYLIVRRVGWLPLTAYVITLAIPLGAYLNWYHSAHGVYAFGQFNGRFLYARTTTFADCDKLDLSARLRVLCPEQKVSERSQRPDDYIWTDVGVAQRVFAHVKYDPYLNEFAVEAIRQQPVDYATVVVRETGWHFAPSLVEFDKGQQCLARAWQLPVRKSDGCKTGIYARSTFTSSPPAEFAQVERIRPALRAYSRHVTVPGPVVLFGVILAFGAAFWRPRRPGWADGRDALLFGAIGFGMLVISVATSMYEPRYMMPSLFFFGMGAALGAHRIMAVRGAAEPTPDPAPDPAPTATGVPT